MRGRLRSMALAAGIGVLAGPASADTLAERQTLTDDWFGQGPAMRDFGFNLRAEAR